MDKKLVEKMAKDYDSLKEIVDNIGASLEKYYSAMNVKFKSEILISQFDCILQYSLLWQALANGELSAEELAVIENLVRRGDLVDYINSKHQTKISWNSFLSATPSAVKKWMIANEKYMDDLAEEFVYCFCMIDGADGEDLYKKLLGGLSAIFAGMGELDGKITVDEINALKDNYATKVLTKIKKQLIKMEQH